MVQFGAIIFCRTFKNYFGQFAWIEKKKKKKSHYNSRVSLHETPTKNVFLNSFASENVFVFALCFSLRWLFVQSQKVNSPLPRVGYRIGSSAFLSRHRFGYYLPIASYGTIFAAKWSSNGGLEAVVSK